MLDRGDAFWELRLSIAVVVMHSVKISGFFCQSNFYVKSILKNVDILKKSKKCEISAYKKCKNAQK